uniref:Uncharacterized protein n=1 Tax=Peronospora matthiolae TaxID=2874970 RepID=A0AAV1V092_9STRA
MSSILSTPPPLERLYDGYLGGSLAGKQSRIYLTIATTGLVHGVVYQDVQDEAINTNEAHNNNNNNCCPAVSAHRSRHNPRVQVEPAGSPNGQVAAYVIGTAQIRWSAEQEPVALETFEDRVSTKAAHYCCLLDVTKGRPQQPQPHHVDRRHNRALTCHLHVPVMADAPAVGTWQRPRNRRWQQDYDHQLRPSTCCTHFESSVTVGDPLPLLSTESTFHLEPVQCQQEAAKMRRTNSVTMRLASPSSVLMPLRPGKYEFKGFTTSVAMTRETRTRHGRRSRDRRGAPQVTTVAKDDCLVTLYLQADGTVHGTSCEVAQPQVCQLKGRWKANRIAYVLEYRVREAVGHFRYSGAIVMKNRETLSGRWYNVDKGHADGYEGGRGKFELELVRVGFMPIAVKREKIENSSDASPSEIVLQQERARFANYEVGSSRDMVIDLCDDDNTIQAFTSGEYELSGCAIDADGYEYAFGLKLQLCPNGKLLGHSTEHVFQQTSPVSGHWGPTQIVYDQQYVVKGEVGLYTYTANMSCNGVLVEGTWINAETELALTPSEHGTFGLIVLHSTRRWSTSSHSRYPPRFRQGVLTTLLTSAKRDILPGAIWAHVFSFCNESWFTAPAKPAQAPSQVLTPCNMLTRNLKDEPPCKRCKHAA